MKAILVALWLVLGSVSYAAAQSFETAANVPNVQGEQAALNIDNSYAIGPGDTLRITVFGEADLTGDYIVATNGSLAFPLFGEIAIAGLTPQQLSDAIATRLRDGYLREPRVATAVTSYRPFYILGEVQEPGTYPYAPGLDAMSAVAVAGGFTYRANRGHIFIRRLGEQTEQRHSLNDRVIIRPGDTVRIGERFF
jgi:polysaccharide export outer membrane protein